MNVVDNSRIRVILHIEMRHSANNPKILENPPWRLSRRPLLGRRASLRAPAEERSPAQTPGGIFQNFR